jgi:hypothetical protein
MAELLTSAVEVHNGLPFRRDNENGAYVLFADTRWHHFSTVVEAKAQIDVISPRMDAADKANLLYLAEAQANTTQSEWFRAEEEWAREQREIVEAECKYLEGKPDPEDVQYEAALEMAEEMGIARVEAQRTRDNHAAQPTQNQREATPMATATAVPNNPIPGSTHKLAVVFPPESILSENPKWYERIGGVNQLSGADKEQAQKDYEGYLKTDTASRLDRYPTLDRYAAARQAMNEDLRTAKRAMSTWLAKPLLAARWAQSAIPTLKSCILPSTPT